MKIKKFNIDRLSVIGGGIVVSAIVITAVVSLLLYQSTVSLLTENLRQRLLSITITQAANLNADEVWALQTEDDWKKPAWKSVVTRMKKAKDSNTNIVFMYIFRKSKDDPKKMVFVSDAESLNPYANIDNDSSNDVDANHDGKIEPNGADQLQWPGQEYPDPPEETFEAYNGPLTSADLYSDSFGKVLTGYAPIKDGSGRIVAILATDIRADDFLTITTQTLYPFILFILFLVLVIAILAFALIRIWNSRLKVLAELDRQKDELLSIVSHQLAAPITAIKWYLELLQDDTTGSEKTEYFGTMQGITANLSDLVSMLLDVSRIQLGKMKPDKKEIALAEFFNPILQVVIPKAQESGVKFEHNVTADLPKAMIDKRLTRMTIENLLTNAIKYTSKDGTVKLNLEFKNDEMLCTVSDTGFGIPLAEQSKIFGKLYRASNVRNTVDGNGFGLYVAKGAIESQGGKLWFESTEGKGTTFYATLPLK